MPTTRTRTTSPSRTTSRFSRTGTPASTGGWRARRQPPKSGRQRAIDSATGALRGLGKSKPSGSSARSRGGKAGGAALVTAAAGLAFKNRDKLMGILGREGKESGAREEVNPTEAGTRPAAGSADPARSGDIAPTDPGNRPDIPPAG